MNRDQISLRINQLQALHAKIHGVFLEAEKLYIANPTEGIVTSSGATEILRSAMKAVEIEISSLREQVQRKL